jgi:hypothetical protein
MKELIVTALLGLSVGHFGSSVTSTPVDTDTNQVQHQVQIQEQIPKTTTTLQLAGSERRSAETNALIAAKVDEASINIDAALAQAPDAAAAMASSINQHGVVKAILYNDPQVTAINQSIGQSMGRGLRALADAVTADMVDATKELHGNGRQL